MTKIDRTGEINHNNFGSKMVISEYRNTRDVDVYFTEYNWTKKSTRYDRFKNGSISCPYERRTCGVGYLGEGEHKAVENGKETECHIAWKTMMIRCYSDNKHEKYMSYIICTVCEEWHNFQNFAEWYENNYYEIENEKMDLDKDILYKGNKIYSPKTCIFVPRRINSLFVKNDIDRGKYPIGVSYRKREGTYVSQCRNGKNREFLGRFSNPIDAFNSYKKYKEKIIKEVADEYKNKIPNELYEALYRYEVEITD